MRNIIEKIGKFKIILLLTIFFTLFANQTVFASDMGILSGKVIDSETGEILRGATIMLTGTKLGGRTDVKGTYRLKDVPVGTYTIRVSYVGYITKEITDIELILQKSKIL
jgi:hypothetical protein